MSIFQVSCFLVSLWFAARGNKKIRETGFNVLSFDVLTGQHGQNGAKNRRGPPGPPGKPGPKGETGMAGKTGLTGAKGKQILTKGIKDTMHPDKS